MFRVTYENTKKFVKASTLCELKTIGCTKFGISPENVILKTSDGYLIDDADAFEYVLSNNTEVLFVDAG